MRLTKKEVARRHFRVNITSTNHPTSNDLLRRYQKVDGLWIMSSPDVGKLAGFGDVPLPDGGHPTGEIVMCVRSIPRVRYVTFAAARNWGLRNSYRFAFPWERDALIDQVAADPLLLTGITTEVVDPGTYVSHSGMKYVPLIQWVEGTKPFSLESCVEYSFDIHTHFLFVKE
ncbi:MAG: hypothetical protein NUW08_00985 [Candidatus Uhrbacteria bacterium]|nr:hypothetical protein [Candidatus Uhrbacteria bacterium]